MAVCYRCLGASRIPAASCNYLECCWTSVISISCCSRAPAAESHLGCWQCLPCTHSSQQQQQEASAQRGCQCAPPRRVKECCCSWWVTAVVSLVVGWGLTQQLHSCPEWCFCKHWSWGLQLPVHDTDSVTADAPTAPLCAEAHTGRRRLLVVRARRHQRARGFGLVQARRTSRP